MDELQFVVTQSRRTRNNQMQTIIVLDATAYTQ